MHQKPKVVLDKLHHRGQDCIAIRFAKDFDLIAEVKKIPGSQFSRTNTCWYVVNDKNVLRSILDRLQLKAWVDYSALRDAEIKPVKKLLPKRVCPVEYIEQLDRKRYSENTKKIYINFFGQFINYFPEIAIDEISDDQVNNYMKHLLATKKVSSSTQNQAINAIKFYYVVILRNTSQTSGFLRE